MKTLLCFLPLVSAPLLAGELATRPGLVSYAVNEGTRAPGTQYYGSGADDQFAEFGLTTFRFAPSDFGAPVVDILSAELTLTVNGRTFSDGDEVEIFFTPDSAADLDSGGGPFSALFYQTEKSPSGIDSGQFVTAPVSLGVFPIPEMAGRAGGETDTLTLPFTGGAAEAALIDAINNGREFQILLAATSKTDDITYSGVGNTNDPGDPLLTIEATPGFPSDVPAIFPRKLNGALADGEIVGSVYRFTPDGGHVLYIAAQNTPGVRELFSVPATGGFARSLSGEPVPGASVRNYSVSSDSRFLVYELPRDLASPSVTDLYSAPVSGGSSTKLNGPSVANGRIFEHVISPDSRWVVYSATEETIGNIELFVAPIEGGGSMKISGPMIPNGDVRSGGGLSFGITPDSRWVVYRADAEVDEAYELFRVPIGGGSAQKLHSDLATGRSVLDFKVSPNGSHVVYQADHDADDVFELYSIPIGGGAKTKLSGSAATGGDVGKFEISSDSREVVFSGDLVTNEVTELFVSRLDGGGRRQLNPPFSFGQAIFFFALSPDGQRVVYTANADTPGDFELYSTRLALSRVTKLNAVPPRNGLSFRITPDSSRVVYVSNRGSSVAELYSVPIGGGAPIHLNGPLAPGGSVLHSFTISPDSTWVAYRAAQSELGVNDLYSVPTTGGTPVLLNRNQTYRASVFEAVISPDSELVLYDAAQERPGVIELFVTRAQSRWQASFGSWWTGANWDNGVVPDRTVQAVLDGPGVTRVSASAIPAEARSLAAGGASGSSVLELVSGAGLTLWDGVELFPGAVLRGDGALSIGSLPFALPAGAEIRVREGERLSLQSGAVTNAGSIEVSGLVPFGFGAELEFAGPVTNEAGTGSISGTGAVFRFPQGLLNRGGLVFGGGFNEVRGNVENDGGGKIVVSGGAAAVFYEDVSNSSLVNVSAGGSLESSAVFFGAFCGNGTSGGGPVFMEGDVRPGFSAGTMSFGGDVSLGPLSRTEIELEGVVPGSEYDRLVVAGALALGGHLEVVLTPPFVPQAGMVFDLWEAGSVSGEFSSMSLPALPPGLIWDTGGLISTGELRVGSSVQGYPQFEAFYGLTTPPDGDQDRDHLANLLEYVTGRNPLLNDFSSPLISIQRSGRDDRLSFILARPAPPDVVIELQSSTTLEPGGWSVIASRSGTGPWTGAASVTVVPVDAASESILIITPAEGVPKRFYRLLARLVP